MGVSQTELEQVTSLYRHFDEGGRLLYVGISLSAMNRLATHMSASDWRHQIATVKIETHPTRAAALAAEALAIKAERPIWNKSGRASKAGLPTDQFPASFYDGEGTPVLAMTITDTEGAAFLATFGIDGGVTLDCAGSDDVALTPSQLRDIASSAEDAAAWYDKALDTDGFHAWMNGEKATPGSPRPSAESAARP